MRPSWLRSLVAVGVSLSVSIQAHAQPVFVDAESIECTVANADRVVIGRIVEFLGGGPADGRMGREAAIAVEESLKEDPLQDEHHQRLRVHLPYPASVLAGWKDHSCRLLVAEREEAPTATTVIDLANEDLEVLTADFTLLRDPEDVIRIAKETVRRMPAAVRRIHTFRLEVPREVVAGTRWGKYSGTLLSVPADERLEKRAHDDIRSESSPRRLEGARALRYFRSHENIERVRALLDDPAWSYLHRAEENQGLEIRIYVVRQEAYRTLRSWGVGAERPAIREEFWMPERVKTVDLSHRQVMDADLGKLTRFENLENLFLWGTPVTDASLKELGGLKNLRSLYLGGTKVTDEGLKHLAGLTSLRYVDLRGTMVTDEGLRVLARSKGLQKIDLGQAQVTDVGVTELRRARPDLEIER